MAILPSRKATAAFIGVFIVGIIVGWLNATNINTVKDDGKMSQFMNHANDPASMVTRISQKYATDYHLTPDQQTQFTPLVKDLAQHLYQLRHQFGVDVLATLDDFHAKAATLMTPEQRVIYAKANEERKKRMTGLLLSDPSQQPAQDQQ